jgi:membrane-associated phospholipid phosphatase
MNISITKTQATMLMALMSFINYVETAVQTQLKIHYGVGYRLQFRIASAFHDFEGKKMFEAHDATNVIAIYGYSFAYFFIFPILLFYVAISLSRRFTQEYQRFALALTIDYLISLVFYILCPVPERWAYPDSGAVLLSDQWSSRLIESFRPMSGLDNCFPSFHVSAVVICIVAAYIFRLRLRHTCIMLGLSVIFSTYVLGIHWLPDILSGVALGCISMAMARWIIASKPPSVWELGPDLWVRE